MPSPKEFLEAVWSGIAEGHAWVRTFQDGRAKDEFFEWPLGVDAMLSALSTAPGLAFMGTGIRSQASAAREDVSAVGALWTTVNLNAVPIARAADTIKAFPAKPSAGILLGDALHTLWFLKAPVGPPDFDLVWAANLAIMSRLSVLGGPDAHCDPFLAKSFSALQASHYDFDGLLRAPGQRGAKFVAWRPEARYTIEELADLVCPRRQEPPQASAAADAAPPPPPVQRKYTYPPQTNSIDDDKATEIVDFIRGMWLEGTRMPSFIAGMFLYAGVTLQSARAVIGEAAKNAGADVEKCLRDVEETYKRAEDDQPVKSKRGLEDLFDHHYAPDEREAKKRKISKLEKLLPKPERPDPVADFEIVKLVKFDSRPARWSVTLKLSTGEDLSATVETLAFHTFHAFQSAFQEQTHFMLKEIRQARWKRMIGDAREMIEVKETPKEARPEGAIENAMDEFMSEAKENPDIGLLRSFPGYDEEARFFRFAAFKNFLKESGLRPEDRVVYDHLKQLGWKNTVRRFGPKLQRLWMQIYEGTGSGNGNGHGVQEGGPGTPHLAPSQESMPDLFPDAGAGEGKPDES